MGHDARRRDDQAALFLIVFDCSWKDEWKLEPAVVMRCLCTESKDWVFDLNRPYDDIRSENQ